MIEIHFLFKPKMLTGLYAPFLLAWGMSPNASTIQSIITLRSATLMGMQIASLCN